MRQKLPLLQQENDDLRQTCLQLARQAGVNPNQIPALHGVSGNGGGGGGLGGGGGGGGGGRGGHFGMVIENANQLRRGSFPALAATPPQAAAGGGGFGSGSAHLAAPPPRRPAPSPFISPTTSHGNNGMDSFTPVHATVQRQALLHSGQRPQLGATLLRGGGSGGGRPGSGGAGMPPPPGSRLPLNHIDDMNPNKRRGSLVPMGIAPPSQQLGFGNGFHQGGGGGGGRGGGSGGGGRGGGGHPGYF